MLARILSCGLAAIVAATNLALAQQSPPSAGAAPATAAPAVKAPDVPQLTAAQIADRNVAARGGLEAWQRVKSMRMSGKMDIGRLPGPPQMAMPKEQAIRRLQQEAQQPEHRVVQVPFVMEMARPLKVRVELVVGGTTAVQVYDGAHGWKLRPYLNRKDAEPFTEEELKTASEEQELDGPLMDYVAKGNKIELAGVEQVEGRNAYKLKVTCKNGDLRNVWIDAHTFLEVKVAGSPRRLDGREHAVETYYRDFRSVSGLMVPFLLETKVDRLRDSQKMTVEHVDLNPSLSDGRFNKPAAS